MFENLNLVFVPIALFYLLCAIVSCVGNGIMILIFVRERSFKSPCHYFITFSCAADLLHLSGHVVFNFHLFTNTTSSQENCYWMLFFTSIGKCMSSPLLLAMGIDRFLACKSAVLYRHLLNRSTIYILAQLVFPIIYTSSIMISGFIQRIPENQIICQVPLALTGTAFLQFNTGGIFVNCAIIIVYSLAYIQLKNYAGVYQMKVVFKSILWTVIFVILGWLSVTIANQFTIFLNAGDYVRRIIVIHAGIGVNLASASNIFVFYAINTEYRDAIRRFLGLSVKRIENVKTISENTNIIRMS